VTTYSVELTGAAAKQVRKLETRVRVRVLAAIASLAEEPRPAGAKKLVGERDAWRIRIGDHRVIYDIHDGVVEVVVFRVAHRREVYN
jgi:mRNA interferase RelE/StbE